jgi:hypothetical protein
VREICELILGLQGHYDQVVKERMEFHGDFAHYRAERNQHTTQFYTPGEEGIASVQINP